MSRLLFDEKPIIADRTLAKLIGLNEAVVLQQIHFWISVNKTKDINFHEGRYWTYNTIKKWQEQEFSYMSYNTLQRTFKRLKELNLIITGNFNKLKMDQTIWYSVNYDELDKMADKLKEEEERKLQLRIEQERQEKEIKRQELELLENSISPKWVNGKETLKPLKNSNSPKWVNGVSQNGAMQLPILGEAIPKNTTENTTEILNKSVSLSEEEKEEIKKTDRKTDKKQNKEFKEFKEPKENHIDITDNDLEELESIIDNCSLYSVEEVYRDSVEEAISTLFLSTVGKRAIQMGDNIVPTKHIVNKLKKLDFTIVDHAINKFKIATKENRIKNPSSYLRSCIYNSISEYKIDIDSELRNNGLI